MSNKIIKIEGDAVRSMNQTTFGEFYSKHSKEDIEEWIQSKGGHGLDMDEIFNDGVACLEWEDVDYVMDTLDVSYEEHSGEVPDKFIHDEEIQKFKEELTEEEYWGTCMVCGEEICANEEQRKRIICGFCYLADDEGTK